MNKKKALDFLKRNQPLPDDSNLTEELIKKYDEIREYFLINPEIECIPYFLNSFGKGDGFGVYQLIGDVIQKFKGREVTPFLISALESTSYSIRYWNAQIAALFPNDALIKPLEKLLAIEDFDIKYSAITALEQIGGKKVKHILLSAIKKETNVELKALMMEISNEL